MDDLKKEVNALYDALGDKSIFSHALVKELVVEHHDPDFADDNDHFWVYPDGNWGSRKPLNMGLRSMHSYADGRSLTVENNYGYWPHDDHGNEPVRVRTKEIAIRLVVALIHQNAVYSLERLRHSIH